MKRTVLSLLVVGMLMSLAHADITLNKFGSNCITSPFNPNQKQLTFDYKNPSGSCVKSEHAYGAVCLGQNVVEVHQSCVFPLCCCWYGYTMTNTAQVDNGCSYFDPSPIINWNDCGF